MLEPILSIILPGLMFGTGYSLLWLIGKRFRQLTLSRLDRAIFGVILWVFLLVATSTIFGISDSHLLGVFDWFLIFSVGIVSMSFAEWIHSESHWERLTRPSAASLLFLLLFFIFAFAAYFQTSYYQYDANYYYLPLARAIQSTGGLQFDPYRLTGLTDAALPAGPLVDAWLLRYGDLFSIKIAGFLFVAFTAVGTYRIGEICFDEETAKIGALIFLSIPCTLLVSSRYSMYLDPAFELFLVALALALMKAVETGQAVWTHLSVVSTGLALLTRELAIFLIPMLLATLIGTSKRILQKIVAILLYGSTFILTAAFDVIRNRSPSFDGTAVQPSNLLVVTLIFMATFGAVIFNRPKGAAPENFPWLKAKYAAPWLLPAILFVARNLITLGAVTIFWIPFGSFRNDSDYIWILNNVVTLYQRPAPPDLIAYFSYKIILMAGSAGPFIFSLLIGVGALVNRTYRQPRFSLLLLVTVLLSIFMLFAFLFPLESELRRFYLIAPFSALVIGLGLERLSAMLGLRKEKFLEIGVMISILYLIIFWRLFIPIQNVADILSSTYWLSQVEPIFWLISVVLPILSIIVYGIIRSRITSLESLMGDLSKAVRITPLIFLLSIVVIGFLFLPFIENTAQNGSASTDSLNQSAEFGLFDVINFYKSHINDSFATVGIDLGPMIFYGNRSLIDLIRVEGIVAFLPVLHAANSSMVVEQLIAIHVRYFLLPGPSNPWYVVYLQYKSKYLVFQMLDMSSAFASIATFKNFALLRLVVFGEAPPV